MIAVQTRQCTHHVLMVRPSGFAYDPQTAATNAFQRNIGLPEDVQRKAILEFDDMVHRLNDLGIDIVVIDPFDRSAPDAVFPNNWFSTHADGTIVYYPMLAESRRSERSVELSQLLRDNGFGVRRSIDLSPLEDVGAHLEGTGSLVLDRRSNIAYAALSDRTRRTALEHFERRCGYELQTFNTLSADNLPVYHTNVMLSVGEHVAVLCPSVIIDKDEREAVKQRLEETMKTVVSISESQMNAFCGNVLELRGRNGEALFVMSSTARKAFSASQLSVFEQHGNVVSCDIPTIEAVGGGSVRCMMAEIFLPKRTR